MIEPTWTQSTPLSWVVAMAALVTALAVLHRYVAVPLARLFTKVERFTDAWNGEQAQDGHPARPGVIARLTTIEGELRPNGGESMRDAVNRIETKIADLTERADGNASGLARLEVGQAVAESAAKAARDLAGQVEGRLTGWIEQGQVREAAYVASLAELGIDLQSQQPRDPSRRTRAVDDS